MFKKFTEESVHSKSNIKSSVQRGIKAKFLEEFPGCEPVIDEIVPRKVQLNQAKCQDKVNLYIAGGELVIVGHYDTLYPSLRLVHRLPKDAFPWVQVDSGAIKFILGGANIMCPGLTSAGADIPQSYEKGQTVVVYAQGKENALAVAKLDMSTDDIKAKNKGIGATVIMYLGDGLWNLEV